MPPLTAADACISDLPGVARHPLVPGPDVLLRDDDGAVLLARARTEETLDEVRDQLPGDRLNAYR